MLLYTLSWVKIGKIMTETPGSCVSENATLSQLYDMALNELICALNAPMEEVVTASAPPGINRYSMFSSVFICEVRR